MSAAVPEVPGVKRIDVQEHDLSVPGRVVIQSRVELSLALRSTRKVASTIGIAMADESRWEEALEVARTTYAAGTVFSRQLRNEVQQGRRRVPVSLAREVVGHWEQYPAAIVALARSPRRG
jgi:hypothetical protein